MIIDKIYLHFLPIYPLSFLVFIIKVYYTFGKNYIIFKVKNKKFSHGFEFFRYKSMGLSFQSKNNRFLS